MDLKFRKFTTDMDGSIWVKYFILGNHLIFHISSDQDDMYTQEEKSLKEKIVNRDYVSKPTSQPEVSSCVFVLLMHFDFLCLAEKWSVRKKFNSSQKITSPSRGHGEEKIICTLRY